MQQLAALAAIFLFSLVLSFYLCGWLRRRLLKRQQLDQPNDRSLHTAPVPRGGGLAVWLTFFLVIVLTQAVALPVLVGSEAFLFLTAWQLPLLTGLTILIFVSWLDDKKPLPPVLRLAMQIATVVIVFAFEPSTTHYVSFLDLPIWLDRLIAGLAWLWFINLTNFMDGMDGITAAQTIHIGLGFIAVYLLIFAASALVMLPLVFYAACLVGAMAGFLYWNWHPARLFLGDVGSIPLGYLLGYLMLVLAASGQAMLALALPAYYLADATITLIRRMLKKEKFWQAHREHFYQKAALRVGHKPVLFAVISANFIILGLCISSLTAGLWVLTGVPLIVVLLLWYLNDMAKKAS